MTTKTVTRHIKAFNEESDQWERQERTFEVKKRPRPPVPAKLKSTPTEPVEPNAADDELQDDSIGEFTVIDGPVED